MRSALALALVTSCAGSPAPAPAVSPAAASPGAAKCSELVEHVVDVAWLAHASQVSKSHAMVGTWNDGYAEDRHEYKKELRASQGPGLSKRCLHATISHVDCALVAETLEAVSTCDASLSLVEQ